jgi:hypothetical protein
LKIPDYKDMNADRSYDSQSTGIDRKGSKRYSSRIKLTFN